MSDIIDEIYKNALKEIVEDNTGYINLAEVKEDECHYLKGYDEYDMAYTIESEENKIVTIDNYIYAIKGSDITIPKGIKLPNYLKGNFQRLVIESEDDIPEEWCNTEIKKLIINSPTFIDDRAFYNCLINDLYINSDVEIGEQAFYQPTIRVVRIHSKYDISDYNWKDNNIIPIFIKE